MSYKLQSFDGLTLPLAMGSGSLSQSAPVGTDYIALPGFRVYDALRSSPARTVRLSYVYDCILIGSSPADLKTKYDALKAKEGMRAVLIRVSPGGGDNQGIQARLTIPSTEWTPQTGTESIHLKLVFETSQPTWYATARSGSALVSETATVLNIQNGGNASCLSPEFTVVAGVGSNISSIRIWRGPDSLGRVWSLYWSGLLLAGTGLMIDCGKMTVKKTDGADAYSGFSLLQPVPSSSSFHNQSTWAEIDPGGADWGCSVVRVAQNFGGIWSYWLSDAWKG